jgi:hypothetical protein
VRKSLFRRSRSTCSMRSAYEIAARTSRIATPCSVLRDRSTWASIRL